MRTARTLVLKKETLAELTSAELQGVAGAAGTTGTVSTAIEPCPTHNDPICERVSRLIRPCPTDFC